MRLREITEQRQQVNEIAPAIVAGIWAVRAGFAAYGMYSAMRGYQTFRSWQKDELTDSEFAAQIGQDAFNTLAGATGGLAALKATKMTYSAFRAAWAAKGGRTAAARATIPAGAGSSVLNLAVASATADEIAHHADEAYDVYTNYKSGMYDMDRVRRELGGLAYEIFRDILIFWGVTKVAVMSWRVFRQHWRRLSAAAALGAGAGSSATPTP